MDEDFDVKEFKKQFEKQRKAKHEMQHVPVGYFEKRWYIPRNMWINIKQAFYCIERWYERARYGVCHKDVWNFDAYLADVIANGCRYLKNKAYGYPGCPGAETPEEWNEVLEHLIKYAEDYSKEPWYDEELPDNFLDLPKEELKKRYDRIYALETGNRVAFLKLLSKWFGSLWD